jgi:hypothetical protein
MTEYFVFLGSEDDMVMPSFENMRELRDPLVNRGTGHVQPWSMGAVVLLEEHKEIPREIGFIKPYNSNYRHQYKSWNSYALRARDRRDITSGYSGYQPT